MLIMASEKAKPAISLFVISHVIIFDTDKVCLCDKHIYVGINRDGNWWWQHTGKTPSHFNKECE